MADLKSTRVQGNLDVSKNIRVAGTKISDLFADRDTTVSRAIEGKTYALNDIIVFEGQLYCATEDNVWNGVINSSWTEMKTNTDAIEEKIAELEQLMRDDENALFFSICLGSNDSWYENDGDGEIFSLTKYEKNSDDDWFKKEE